MQRIIELMESIADYRRQIESYRTYVAEHPSCSFEWEGKIARMEKVLNQLELKFQLASCGL